MLECFTDKLGFSLVLKTIGTSGVFLRIGVSYKVQSVFNFTRNTVASHHLSKMRRKKFNAMFKKGNVGVLYEWVGSYRWSRHEGATPAGKHQGTD